VDVVVKGRNVEVPEHFRVHVSDKLRRVERYDNKIIEVDVELLHERNPRQSDSCQRVEITCVSRGPVVRAEACAPDFYAALERAADKLEARLRRAADRRRVHHGRHAPLSVAAVTAPLVGDGALLTVPAPAPEPLLEVEPVVEAESLAAVEASAAVAVAVAEAEQADDQPWHVARTKEHPSEPMTIDDALFQMELVGHDFYLFLDKDSGRPSVVYRRRKGYDYGVISLAEPLA
jgi:ribosomal subunit interface protein